MLKSVRLIGVACVLAMACACPVGAADVTTIAVMPFANITKDPQVDWLRAGFAETIATKLCMVSGIQYVERSQLSQALKELKLQDTAVVDTKTAGKLGKVLGAKQVIIGSFQKSGDKLKVDARVVDVQTSTASRSADDTGTMDGVFDLQADLARKLIEALGKTATEAESEAVAVAPTKSLNAYEWFSKGYALQQQGKLSEAIQAYTSATELDPAYADAYNNRGAAYCGKGEHDKAIADYDKALQIKPDYAEAYVGRGAAYNGKGEYDKAIADYNKALQIKPNYADAYINRGSAYYGKRDYDKAIADFDEALRIKPDSAEAYSGRSVAYYGKREYDKAIADLDKAIQINPNYADAYSNRGAAYCVKGEYDKAIADYDKALQIKPDHAYSYFGRGAALEAQGKREEAIAAFRQFIKLAAPGDTEWINNAKQRIEALEKQ